MPSLFQTVPAGLFRPLAAQGAPIYSEALLTLFAQTRRQQQPLSRDRAVDLVAGLLTDPEALISTEDAVDDDDDDAGDVRVRAGAILRYLTRCGWLRTEVQSDYTQTFTLPDYAFRLLNTLDEITLNRAVPLQGLICSIHDLLKASVREGDAHYRLPEAHRQTIYLLSGLKELQHNIGAHIEQVLRQRTASDVLRQTFSTYRDEIVDRAYHQLRTSDHVSRFRPDVFDALVELGGDVFVEATARRMRASGEAPTVESAASALLDQIHEIHQHFEDLDRLIESIDIRHSQFVDSAVRTVELQLSATTTTSGQLHDLLDRALHGDGARDSKDDAPATDDVIALFDLEVVDAESLAPPARAATPFVPEMIATTTLSADQIAEAHRRTRQQLGRTIGRERVRRFAQDLLRDRDNVRAADIPLAGPDDLPLLIYLRCYGDGSLGYHVEEHAGTWVEHDGVGFRDFTVRAALGSNSGAGKTGEQQGRQ